MKKIVASLDRHFYLNYSDNWDDKLFRKRIMGYIQPHHKVLDLGAGAGIVKEMNFLGMCSKICGIDVDPRITTNPMLNEGKIADATNIPYPNSVFDLVVSDNVMEHVSFPERIFSEVNRVLKPGCVFLFKTPNIYHYMPLIARITPHRFHQYINGIRGRKETDTFPTRYKVNSKKAVRRLCATSGFDCANLLLVEGRPEYTRIAWPLYLIGITYERIVNSSRLLENLRLLIIAELVKNKEVC